MTGKTLTSIGRRADSANSLLGWTASIAVSPNLHNLPLVNGLAASKKVSLFRQNDHLLPQMLSEGKIDVALLGAIDLQRQDLKPLIIPSGCISCDGSTHTAIIYSRVPPATIRRLYVEENCQTAAAVAGIIWAETYERKLQIMPRPQNMPERHIDRPQAIMFYGDRVCTQLAEDYAWKIDIGKIWHDLTGLPLVFSIWAMQPDSGISPTLQARRAKIAADILDAARISGMSELENIVSDYAAKFGWPVETARNYLLKQMQYKFTSSHQRGLDMFFHLARKYGYIKNIRPLSYSN